MDYEKAYKAVLQTATQWINDGCTDKEKICLECVFPELRESEDERIRKELLNFVKSFWVDHKEKLPQSSRWVTFLENLKEQKPLIKKGVKYYCIKAQKRNTDFYTYAFTVGTEYIAPENNVLIDNDGHSWDLTIQTPEWIFERFTPKESKPEWSYPYGKNETVDRLVSIAECLEMNGDCVYNGYKGDECGVFLRALAREYLCIEELVNVVQDKNLMDILYYASSDDHFPSLRKLHTLLTSYNEQKEQKPVEWSEEDADILNCCISSIEEAKENRYAYKETDGDTSYDHEIAWLKSLSPSWKPSEEQMSCLCAAVDAAIRKHNESVSGYKPARVLKSLYEQLRKL